MYFHSPASLLRALCLGLLVIPMPTGVSASQDPPAREPEQDQQDENEREEEPASPPLFGLELEHTDKHSVPRSAAERWYRWGQPKGRASGDWAGIRPWLDDHGFTLEVDYLADFFYNFHGGLNTSDAEQFRGLLGIGLAVDTEKVGLWEGGTVFVSMFENHGTDISGRHVGDLQALNNADAPNRVRLYEWWYEQILFDGAFRIKLGKMDANEEFAAPDNGGEFVHSSPGFSPTIPFPTWPDTALGIVITVEPTNWMFFKAGIFDSNRNARNSGFDTAFHSPDDSFTISELGFHANLSLFGRRGLHGTYRVGAWFESGEWDILTPRVPALRGQSIDEMIRGPFRPSSHRGNWGVYAVLDQQLYEEDPEDEDNEQGLGMFFQFGWAPSDYNTITQHYGGGLRYQGFVPGRDEDICGLGVHHVSLSGKVQSMEGRYSETAIEAFYQIQVTEFLSVKPDIHYIINPGGDGKDAIVAGVRLEISF